mgnify:FL=1
MNQQTIVLVHYPYTHFKETKIRPAVVLSKNDFNRKHAFCILSPITSHESMPEFQVEIATNEFTGRLDRKSYIRSDTIMSIHKGLILDEIGKISPQLYQKTIQKINENFG